jgi:S-adenosylmethionine synthetase
VAPFSGKDPSKVDRSAAYMGRWVAKNVVAAGLAKRCETPGRLRHRPPAARSIHIDTFGSGSVRRENPRRREAVFSFKPADIVRQLDLLRPIYSKSTNYGHFGKDDKDLTWEATDKVAALQSAAA